MMTSRCSRVSGGTLMHRVEILRAQSFHLPYKEPSGTLAQLLAALVEGGRRFVSLADQQIVDANGQAPVGTTVCPRAWHESDVRYTQAICIILRNRSSVYLLGFSEIISRNNTLTRWREVTTCSWQKTSMSVLTSFLSVIQTYSQWRKGLRWLKLSYSWRSQTPDAQLTRGVSSDVSGFGSPEHR